MNGSWSLLMAITGTISLLGGACWYLCQFAFPGQTISAHISDPAAPRTCPWPADVGDYEFVKQHIRVIACESDALARRLYSNLSHENYDEAKRDVTPEAIVARWYVADAQGARIHPTKAHSPARSASIHLSQNHSGKISDVTIIGSCKSADGWSASIQYSAVRESWFHILVDGSPIPMNSDFVNRIDLVNPSFQSGEIESGTPRVTVSLEATLTHADWMEQPIPRNAVAPFFRSAESLRDESLRRLDLLEAKLEQQIRSGSGFTVTDWADVRSDNPPRPMPRRDGPLPKAVEQICLQRTTEILNKRRAAIREHYRSIHRIVADAFPFYSVIVQAAANGE